MGEDFETSVDTSALNDVSADIPDTSSISDPLDVGELMDNTPADPIDDFNATPVDSVFEAELPGDESLEIGSLMGEIDDAHSAEDLRLDVQDSLRFDPSDIASGIDDYEMDAGSDIADLMDEAAFESIEEVPMETPEDINTPENDIETLMNEVEPVSNSIEGSLDFGSDAPDSDADNVSDVEAIMDSEGLSPDESSDLLEGANLGSTEEVDGTNDVATLMDEGGIDDSQPSTIDSSESLSGEPEAIDDMPVAVDLREDTPTEETPETTVPLDTMPSNIDSDNSTDITDNPENVQEVTDGSFAEDADTQSRSPLDDEVSAYDQLADYYSSHNFGPQDYEQYSKDPEWQELNNSFLAEMGRDPIDYNGDSTPDAAEIRDELVAAGIPEGSPELEAIVANELEGEENINETGQEPDFHTPSIDEEADSIPEDVALDSAEPSVDVAADENDLENEIQMNPEDIPSDIPTTQSEIETDIPDQTARVYDDFEQSVLEGKPDFYESGSFYEQGINEFGYQGTCGPTSQANALNELFDTNEFTENKVLSVAIDNNLCSMDSSPEDCGGTTTEQFMELYDKMNEQLDGKISTELYEFNNALDVDDVAAKLDEGCVLNVAVDAAALWDQPREYVNSMGIPCDDFFSDHWITVTGVQRDEMGNIQGFDIIDSGGGVNFVDAEKYHEMCFGTDEHRVIDPTAIVVSKKEMPATSDINREVNNTSDSDIEKSWFQRVFGRRNR